MNFITGLPLLVDWKSNSYDAIFVIINGVTKLEYYKPVKTMIDVANLVKVIINIVVKYHNRPGLIISNWSLLFSSKFWSSLYYFLGIKQRLSTTFYLSIDGQLERQNSIIKHYLCVFVNSKQSNWTKLLHIVEFMYNNAKNTYISYTPFELNCGHHPYVFFQDDANFYSKSCLADELVKELKDLMLICQQNRLNAQEIQKRSYDKGVKLQSYVSSEKIWLNSKYIRTK